MVTAVNSSCRSFALCVMGVTLVGCGSNDADRALQAARDKALHADYLVVSDGRGRSLFSSQLTVIERGGRILAWTREVVVDAAGRPLLERVRSAKNGVVPATAWRERRYAFVDRATFERLAGAPPQPRC
jgi:hypothetical protein